MIHNDYSDLRLEKISIDPDGEINIGVFGSWSRVHKFISLYGKSFKERKRRTKISFFDSALTAIVHETTHGVLDEILKEDRFMIEKTSWNGDKNILINYEDDHFPFACGLGSMELDQYYGNHSHKYGKFDIQQKLFI